MSRKKTYVYYGFILFLFIMIMVWMINIINENTPFIDTFSKQFIAYETESYLYVIARMFTELGSKPFLVPFTIVCSFILLWVYRDWLPSLIFVGGTLASYLINALIKQIISRDRPSILIEANAEGYSFPSGHAMISTVCYGLLLYFIVKKISLTLLIKIVQLWISLLIVLIGMSRFIINVHYLTDVLSGFVFGYILLILGIYLYNYLHRQSLSLKD